MLALVHDDLRTAVDASISSDRTDLEDVVRIPSVSADGFDPRQVRKSAEVTAQIIERAGVRDVQLLEIDGAHPAVYGELAGPPGAPSVLLYAHHDVQPAGDESAWDTPAFEPVERDGRLFGRGASDDKAGIVVHAAALRAHRGAVPVGVKVFIEGEEEVGSAHLEDFLERYGERLGADAIVIADSTNWRLGEPALTTSLRGLIDCVIEIRTLEQGVHSGLFGGALPDALSALSQLLASLHDRDGRPLVKGLGYGDAAPLDLTEAELREQAGALDGVELIGAGNLTSRLWTQPAISVLAIDAPRTEEAINQLIPVARAKVSVRLAPGDDPDRAMDALVAHLQANVPWGAQLRITRGDGAAPPVALASGGAAYRAFHAALAEAWGRPAVEIGIGGSIPFVSAFSQRFPAASVLLTGVGDPLTRAHGPNESQDLNELRRGCLAEAIALRLLAST